MPETNNRNLKILGATWLGIGALAFVYAFVSLFSLAQGNAPTATEVSDGYWVFVALGLVIGAMGVVNGTALLRRNRIARPALVVSSLVLILPSLGLLVPLLVVVPSLWLTLSKGGKEALEGYMAKECRGAPVVNNPTPKLSAAQSLGLRRP